MSTPQQQRPAPHPATSPSLVHYALYTSMMSLMLTLGLQRCYAVFPLCIAVSPNSALVAHSAVSLGASLPWRDDGSNIGPRLASSKMSLKTITIKHQTLPPSLSRAGRVQAGVIIKLNGFGLNIVIGNLNSHREDTSGMC